MSKECKNCDKVDECKNFEPFEPIETAFRGIVRKCLVSFKCNDRWLKVPWADVTQEWPATTDLILEAFNATLDLAKGAAHTNRCGVCGLCVNQIETLREPTP